jgi:hypothetical protein
MMLLLLHSTSDDSGIPRRSRFQITRFGRIVTVSQSRDSSFVLSNSVGLSSIWTRKAPQLIDRGNMIPELSLDWALTHHVHPRLNPKRLPSECPSNGCTWYLASPLRHGLRTTSYVKYQLRSLACNFLSLSGHRYYA